MNQKNRLQGFAAVCLDSALVIQLSWIPALALLEGSAWATPRLAGASHFFGLAFMLAAPLAFGARMWIKEHGDPEVLKDWLLRCLAPTALFAAAIQGVVLAVPHVTQGVIVALMIGTLPLGFYAVLLRREASEAGAA